MKTLLACALALHLSASTSTADPATVNPLGTPLAPWSEARTLAFDESSAEAKSPRKAFFLSLLLPGLGELYAGAKYRAAGFMATEAITWVAYTHWRSSGTSLRDEFRAYADRNWNEARYRQWQAFNTSLPADQQWQETETLPSKQQDEQQYYELIGKYDQFIFGWSDVADEPLSVNNQSVVSPLQSDYEILRNDSNQPLKRASVVIGLTVVNRIISAIHASTYTKLRNPPAQKRLRFELSPSSPSGRYGVSASVATSF